MANKPKSSSARRPREPSPPKVPSFGATLKGFRTVRVDLAPDNMIPNTKTSDGNHICWWDDSEEIFNHSIAMRCIKKVKQPFSIILDEYGLFVPRYTFD